jgi:hypothetical protein
MVSDKTKHIDLKFHFLKDHVEKGTVRLMYLPTYQMVADTLTKPLYGPALSMHTLAMMGTIGPMNRRIPSLLSGGVL